MSNRKPSALQDRPRRRPGPPLGSQNHKKAVRGKKYEVYLLPNEEAFLHRIGKGSRRRAVAFLIQFYQQATEGQDVHTTPGSSNRV